MQILFWHSHAVSSSCGPRAPDAGSSRLLALPKDTGIAEFRQKVTGYLVAGGQQDVVLELKPAKRPVTLTVFARGDEVLAKETAFDPATFSPLKISLPRANEYRFVLEGDAFVRTTTQVPLLYEASPTHPAWDRIQRPALFLRPAGTRQIYLDTRVRFSFHIPSQAKRIDVTPADRKPGQSHIAIDVPAGADGQLWHTDRNTRGQFLFLNIPPLLSLHRTPAFVPRRLPKRMGLRFRREILVGMSLASSLGGPACRGPPESPRSPRFMSDKFVPRHMTHIATGYRMKR